jgi:integrase/recombinase XerC
LIQKKRCGDGLRSNRHLGRQPHSFRATGITAYLKNGGTLEKAASMANHASTGTTQLYDRRSDEVTLDEVERVGI